jgi:predicted DNA-binding transcriptional regulator YafY
MSGLKYITRLERIDQFIRQERTGTAPEFAGRLEISVRQLYNLIEELKDLGLPIEYCRIRRTFFYRTQCRIVFEIKVNEMDNGAGKSKS